MKFIIVFVALFAIAVARPSDITTTVHEESNVLPESYDFNYALSDGTKHDSAGHLKDVGTDHEAIDVHGSYSWVDPEGHTHTISYSADENGYKASGEDVPVAYETMAHH